MKKRLLLSAAVTAIVAGTAFTALSSRPNVTVEKSKPVTTYISSVYSSRQDTTTRDTTMKKNKMHKKKKTY